MSVTTAAPARIGLRRSMRLLHAAALVVGIIIGASIFVQPSEITREVPSIAGILGVWLVAGLLTLAGALICAELASAFPQTGGVYVFLRETFSPAVGFLWGWAMFWSMHSGIIAAVAVIFARYAAYFVPMGAVGIKAVAVGAILVVSAVNYVGVQHGSRLQTAFTVGKVVAIALLIAAGFALGADLPQHFAVSADAGAAGVVGAGGAGTTPAGFLRAIGAGLFAFGGWHMVTYAAGETVEPERTIPRALVLGMAVVIACYIALNTVYLYVLPLEVVATSTRVAADAADAVLGAGGGATLSALVVFSTAGALGGLILAGPRVYWSMAEDRLLFRWAGAVHPRFRTPHRAIALQAVWASVLVATGSYRALFTRVVYTEWIFFALMAAGLFVLRRRTGYAPAYRVRAHPVLPALFILVALAVVLNQVASQPVNAVIGLAIVAAGLPVYAVWRRQG
ncbi:MAG TPA: amino acid permease [Longimicrobiales bacterium]